MDIVRQILNDFVIFFDPRTRGGLIRLGIIVVAIASGGIFFATQNGAPTTDTTTAERGVHTQSVASFNGAGSLSLVGSVAAIDRAEIRAEIGGRVTSVRTELGDSVSAGTIIATLENSAQQAAVLQAEGAYEAALAAAEQGNVSVSEARNSLATAQNGAVNAYTAAYNTVNSALLNDIDTFFANPQAQTVPGLRLQGGGYTSYLNNERVAFRSMLDDWRTSANSLSASSDLESALLDAEERTTRVIEMVDVFIELLNDQDRADSSYTQNELNTFSTRFTALRGELNNTRNALENARTNLVGAEEALNRAQIGGTEGKISTANANVKQALGSLRSAQSNYNKTILRSSIAGDIQSLNVHTGDYVSAMTTVATVANKNALEITTHISANERSRITIGDTVRIEDNIDGTVTAIAPGVDPATGKIEVKIQSQSKELENGDTVRLSLLPQETNAEDVVPNGPITIPITALKVETDRTVVFTVSDNNTLIAHEITEGPLLGNSIVIEDGITADMEIVTDARGLNEGDAVTVLQ